jgi:hypothetical protein
MSDAKVTFTYTDGDSEIGKREMTLTKSKEEFTKLDMLYFFGDAMRSSGFTNVERVGCCDERSAETWSEF